MNMIAMLCAVWRRNLECGDKSRAVRGSRHRFLSVPCAETRLVPTLSRIHLVSTLSRLRQRRNIGTKSERRSVSAKCFGRRVLDEVYPTKCFDEVYPTKCERRVCANVVKKLSTLNHLRHLCHLWMKPETRNPKPTLCVSAVKWSLPLLLAATCAYAVRDPFWPIGYEPPKPEPEVVEQPAPALPEKPPAQEKPEPPPPPPITEDDWKAARDLFTVSGFTQSKNPVSGETRTLAMINRVSYTVGDTLTVTNDNIHFIWSIESLADLTLKLKPVSATRLLPNPLPAQ